MATRATRAARAADSTAGAQGGPYARRPAVDRGAPAPDAAYYRYAERGFSAGSNDIADYAPFYDSMSPLAQAILEPAHYNHRPGIADLLAEQEGASA